MTRKSIGLSLIILVALAVRVYGTLQFPFEQDELYTLDEATNLFNTKLLPGIQARPLFFLMEHPLVTNLPQTPAVLRLIPLVFGLLGIWVTWLLARRILDETGALFATLLVALSPWHMYASGFTRYYSLVYFLAALVYWRLPIAYDSDAPRDYLMVAVALLLGLWTHPSFVFPVASATLAVMFIAPRSKVTDASIASRRSVGWHWPSRNGWLYLWIPFFVGAASIWAIIRAVHGSSAVDNGGDRGLLATIRLIPAMIDWMTPVIFVTSAIGAFLLLGSSIREQKRFGLMTLFGVVGMLLALFGLSFKTSIYADYGIAALPLVFVACGAVIQWIRDAVSEPQRRLTAYVVGAIILIGTLPSVVSYLSDGTRFDYRPAFARIDKEDKNLAVLGWPIILVRKYAPEFKEYELLPNRPRLDSILTKEREAWAVVSVKRYGIANDDRGDMARWLSDNCRLVDQYQRPRLDYRMYRVDLWRCTATQ